jgi:hypothetical protein
VDRPRFGLRVELAPGQLSPGETDLVPDDVVPSRFGLGETDLGFPESLLSRLGLGCVGLTSVTTVLLEIFSSIGKSSDSGKIFLSVDESCCGGVGALVGRNGQPDPNLDPEFGDGGGGPE